MSDPSDEETQAIDEVRSELSDLHDPDASMLADLAEAIASIRKDVSRPLDRDAIWASVETHLSQLDPPGSSDIPGD